MCCQSRGEFVPWFDPGVAIAVEDAVVLLAMGNTYPDLRFVERLTSNRLAVAQMRLFHTQERPAFFEPRFGGQERDVLTEVHAMLTKQQG